MIKHRHKCGKKYDDGQYIERDRKTQNILGVFTEYEADPVVAIVNYGAYGDYDPAQSVTPVGDVQYQRRDADLQGERDGDGTAIYGPTIA